MRFLDEKNWKGFLLLSVVIPMSFLAVFKLTGFIGEFPSVQTSLPAKEWVFQRPYPPRCLTIREWLNTTYNGDEISFTVSLLFDNYHSISTDFWTYGDEIEFSVFINASTNVKNYHFDGLELLCGNDTESSDVSHLFSYLELENLKLVHFDAPPNLVSSQYAILRTVSVNNPDSIYLTISNIWSLHDNMSDAREHILQVIIELKYSDGFVQKSITQFINLKVCANEAE